MTLAEVKFDCKYFKGTVPCKPNKQFNFTCPDCPEYRPTGKKILIIKLGALGDVIRTTPLLVKYRQLYPDAHFTWVTLSPSILPKEEIDIIYALDAIAILNISMAEYDIAINLDKEEEACKLLSTVKSREKYGFTWKDGHIDVATPASQHKLLTGLFDQLSIANTKSYLEEIFEICHLEFNYEPYLINLNHTISDHWKELMQEKAGGKVIVGLNTGCGPRWNTRLWSDEAWMSVAEGLKELGLFPVFLGGQLEDSKNIRMSTQTDSYYPGHFSLEEFIALTNSCDVVITQVSMMMHIATALEKKMILLNNIFNSYEFELYGRGQIVSPPTPCECFYGNTCKRGELSCMHDILPETVVKAVAESLN